jgi:FlaG/FlaF family flagellin (archaellin)
MFKRFSKTKRAVSPIISTLMVLGIVSTLFTIIFVWYFPQISLSQSVADMWYGNQEDSERERIAIEMIYFNETSNTIDVYVRNVGEIHVDIVALYINGSDISSQVSPILNDGYRLYVTSASSDNNVKFLIDRSSDPWTNGDIYNIRVATGRGSWAAKSAEA